MLRLSHLPGEDKGKHCCSRSAEESGNAAQNQADAEQEFIGVALKLGNVAANMKARQTCRKLLMALDYEDQADDARSDTRQKANDDNQF